MADCFESWPHFPAHPYSHFPPHRADGPLASCQSSSLGREATRLGCCRGCCSTLSTLEPVEQGSGGHCPLPFKGRKDDKNEDWLSNSEQGKTLVRVLDESLMSSQVPCLPHHCAAIFKGCSRKISWPSLALSFLILTSRKSENYKQHR